MDMRYIPPVSLRQQDSSGIKAISGIWAVQINGLVDTAQGEKKPG